MHQQLMVMIDRKEGGRYYDEIHVFRSFRTSGHQTKMDVIGNNVANVNTVGFKSSRVTFQEVFSQTLKGASSPDPTTGEEELIPCRWDWSGSCNH